MIKPFPNLIYKQKDKNLSSSKSKLKQEENAKSKPLIIFGFIISLTSIFLFFLERRFGKGLITINLKSKLITLKF